MGDDIPGGPWCTFAVCDPFTPRTRRSHALTHNAPGGQHPSAGAARARGSIRRIAIGGRLLEDLQVRIDRTGYLSCRAFHGAQYSVLEDAQGVTRWLPTLAALQLHHEGGCLVTARSPWS
jgi:hypothetical protein